MSHRTLLHVQHVSKTYSGIPALLDAELDLRAGEVHALMGENGAGKSTLIKLLAGVIAPDHAEISLDGKPVSITSPQSAFAHGLRFIHQELLSIPHVSAAENIFLGQAYPTLFGVKVRWKQLYAQAELVLKRLGIDHIDPSATMAHLSPGDQMLINIARAFVGDQLGDDGDSTLIYVMDEPTAALTRTETEQLFRVIDRLRARGSAVLYVSHRINEILQIADRVTVMRDGRVIGTHEVHTVTSAELIRMMTGRELVQIYPPRTQPIGDQVLLDARDLHTSRLHGVSFTLRAGEILGVAGLIGAGRTELLRVLMGVDRLHFGQILLDGTPLKRWSPARAWQERIAFIPEERRSQGLILSRSIANNITLPQLRHFSRGGIVLTHGRERSASSALGGAVRLKARAPGQTVRELSGGNQQKVMFARALAQPPRVLLLDEPTRGVDVGAKVDIYHLIREISGRGTGIVLVSSDLPELLGMTDRILILQAGRLLATLPTHGQTQASLLACCYGEFEHGNAIVD